MDLGQGISSAGNSIGSGLAAGIKRWQDEKKVYEQQAQLAEALGRIGINKEGKMVPFLDAEGKKVPDISPVLDQKTKELFLRGTEKNRAKATGALEALNHIGLQSLQQQLGPLRQAQIESQRLANQRFPTEVAPGTTLPLDAGQAASIITRQQEGKQPPAGKQFWEGDDESPPGYYTPNQVANIRNRKQGQQAKGAYQDLKTQITLTKDKTSALTKELSEFSQSYGFPPTLFESTTKVYEEGSTIGKNRTIPKGYYGIETVNPKTGDINVLNVGKEEFKQGKELYGKLKEARKNIEGLGGKLQTETAKAQAMLDWANRNPGAQGAVQARAKAQAILSELSTAVNQPAPTPSPASTQDDE